jgi:osmotically-inducible protein OsmY
MKNTLLFSTLVIGLALTGCNKSTRTSTAANDATRASYPADTTTTPTTTTTTTSSTDTLGSKIDRAGDRISDASRNAADRVSDTTRDAAASMRQAGHDLSAKMTEWRLSASDIEADVNAGRPVVRTNSAAGAPTGKLDADNVEKTIKGKLQADSKVADLKFDVNANSKGEVELEGKARNAEEIAAAMACALDTEGVTQVTSKIKIDPKAGPNR